MDNALPSNRLRLWTLLTGLAVAGFLASLPSLLPLLATVAAKSHRPLAVLVFAQGLQLAVLCGLAALAGIAFAGRAGFDAPWLRALADGVERPKIDVLRAAFLGTAATAATLAALLAVRPFAPAELWAHGHPDFLRGASSAFYGGIVEELLMRWGLLSAVVLLLRKNFWAANVAVALVFGIGHLPAAMHLGVPLSAGLLAHVLLGNGVAGLFLGWIYRKHGLESAMIAHAVADVWLHGALVYLT